MRPRWRLIGPWMAAGSGLATIIELALGQPWPSVLDYLWPATVIAWSLLVLSSSRTNEINQKTISSQRKLIEQYREQSARNIGGRWN